MLNLNPNDPAYKPLFEAAGRIAALLRTTIAKPHSELSGPLDDFLGAVCALTFAKQQSFTNRPDRSIKIASVVKLADQISAGKLPMDRKWMAGFHFNSALFRTAAVSHRILQIVVGEDIDVPRLCDKAEKLYPKWKPGHWSSGNVRKVCTEVNKLKHRPKGLLERRNVAYEDALAAVSELLDLIEAWSDRNTRSPSPTA